MTVTHTAWVVSAIGLSFRQCCWQQGRMFEELPEKAMFPSICRSGQLVMSFLATLQYSPSSLQIRIMIGIVILHSVEALLLDPQRKLSQYRATPGHKLSGLFSGKITRINKIRSSSDPTISCGLLVSTIPDNRDPQLYRYQSSIRSKYTSVPLCACFPKTIIFGAQLYMGQQPFRRVLSYAFPLMHALVLEPIGVTLSPRRTYSSKAFPPSPSGTESAASSDPRPDTDSTSASSAVEFLLRLPPEPIIVDRVNTIRTPPSQTDRHARAHSDRIYSR